MFCFFVGEDKIKKTLSLLFKFTWKARLNCNKKKWAGSTVVLLLTSRLANRTERNEEQRQDLCSNSLKSMGKPTFCEHQEERNTLKNPATQEYIWFPSFL